MNRDEAKQLLPIMQAYADGKDIEVYNPNSRSWEYVINPTFSPNFTYRIKPDPIVVKYRRYIYSSGDMYYVAALTYVLHHTRQEQELEEFFAFVRWIDTNWITEEVEINNESN